MKHYSPLALYCRWREPPWSAPCVTKLTWRQHKCRPTRQLRPMESVEVKTPSTSTEWLDENEESNSGCRPAPRHNADTDQGSWCTASCCWMLVVCNFQECTRSRALGLQKTLVDQTSATRDSAETDRNEQQRRLWRFVFWQWKVSNFGGIWARLNGQEA